MGLETFLLIWLYFMIITMSSQNQDVLAEDIITLNRHGLVTSFQQHFSLLHFVFSGRGWQGITRDDRPTGTQLAIPLCVINLLGHFKTKRLYQILYIFIQLADFLFSWKPFFKFSYRNKTIALCKSAAKQSSSFWNRRENN